MNTVGVPQPSINWLVVNRRSPRGAKVALVTKARSAGSVARWMPVVTLFHNEVPQSEFRPLVHFFIERSPDSYDWKHLVARAFSLLVEFVDAKAEHYAALKRERHWLRIADLIYKDFSQALRNGTITVENGHLTDSSQLWWTGLGLRQARRLVGALNKFFVWMDGDGRGPLVNAGVIGDPLSGTGATAALLRPDYRSSASLLGHLHGKASSANSKKTAFPREKTLVREAPVYRFPDEYISEFLIDGFRSRDGELDFCAALIAFMIIMGGVRSSEPFNFWVNDFTVVAGRPYVFMKHPSESIVNDPLLGTMTREEYLRRTGNFFVPRHRSEDCFKAGWKGVLGDLDEARIGWLEQECVTPALGIFTSLMLYYTLVLRPKIMLARRRLGLPDHPWLFVGSGQRWGKDVTNVGDPYTMSAFHSAWPRALKRLRDKYDEPRLLYRKNLGTTPHGGRHFYGFQASVLTGDPIAVMNLMHHLSPFSQFVYTRPTADEYQAALSGDSNAKGLIIRHFQAFQKFSNGRRWR